jgi:hypothetical protein
LKSLAFDSFHLFFWILFKWFRIQQQLLHFSAFWM